MEKMLQFALISKTNRMMQTCYIEIRKVKILLQGDLYRLTTKSKRDVAEAQENKGSRLQASGKLAGTRCILPLLALHQSTG